MERKILLIDKDEFYINFVQERLQKERFEVEVAKTPSEAYEKIYGSVPDLIISARDSSSSSSTSSIIIPTSILSAIDLAPLNKFWS